MNKKLLYLVCVLMVSSVVLSMITLVFFNPQVSTLKLKVSLFELENTLLESRIKLKESIIEAQEETLDKMRKRLDCQTDANLKELGIDLPKIEFGRLNKNEQHD